MTSDLVKRLRLDGLPNSIKEEAADRIEALEAALRLIVDYHAGGPQTASYIQGIALAALAPEQNK